MDKNETREIMMESMESKDICEEKKEQPKREANWRDRFLQTFLKDSMR